MAKNLREKGILLSTRQTVEKLCDIIDKNAFESGAHIDYYDRWSLCLYASAYLKCIVRFITKVLLLIKKL